MDVTPYQITENTTIIDAMGIINRNAEGIVFVCRGNVLLASLTDGDIRRYILKNQSLTAPAILAANFDVKYIKKPSDKYSNKTAFSDTTLRAFPVVDDKMQLVEILFPNKTVKSAIKNLNLPVVIMAGGMGTRLYPYTKVLPKPLIPIGDDTITEHIMNEFIKCGCDVFTLIVNYKKNMIKAYFSEESQRCKVDFLDEDKPLGTGGGLKLLDQKIFSTFFMTNCDIMVYNDYEDIYNHHKQENNILTMVCVTKQSVFPYGTVDINEQGKIIALKEKPTFSFLTNAGFYVIEPRFFDFIPKDTFIHITDIIQKCIDLGENVGIYPVSEDKWYDMGQPEELERMRMKVLGVYG